MPVLGADMKSRRARSLWHKQPGDTVARGEVIAEVETEKAVVEVEAMYGGTVEKLVVERRGEGRSAPCSPIHQDLKARRGALRRRLGCDSPSTAVRPAVRPARRPPSAPSRAPGACAYRRWHGSWPNRSGVNLSRLTGAGPRRADHAAGYRGGNRESGGAGAASVSSHGVRSNVEERQLRMRQGIAAAMSRSHREYRVHVAEHDRHEQRQSTGWPTKTRPA